MSRPVTTSLIELPSGVSITARCSITTDWASVRMMVESGVPIPEVATLFKITTAPIKAKSFQERWLTPSRVDKLRKALAAKQVEVYNQTGMTKPVLELKAQLWEERSERWKEKQAEIVERALEGIDPEVNVGMIKEAKDFKTIVEIARTLTGETQAEDNAPKLAVSIGFLRSPGPRPVMIEAEQV